MIGYITVSDPRKPGCRYPATQVRVAGVSGVHMRRVPRRGAQECCLDRQTATSVGPDGLPTMPPESRRPRPGQGPRLSCGRCPVRGVVRWL